MLLGVNGDPDREAAKEHAAREQLTWRSWWNDGPGGALTMKWRIHQLPSFFALDHRGVIRFRSDALDSPDAIVQAVEVLLREAELEKSISSAR